MTIRAQQIQFGRFPGGGLGCLIFVALLVAAAYYVLKGLYYLLWWAAPALLVLALIINWRVYPRAITSWLDTLESKPVEAILQAAFAALAFPFFSLWLFLKAVGTRHLDRMQQTYTEQTHPEGEFIEFEELESKPMPNKPDAEPLSPTASEEK